jgi:DNA-directed RNA polymerase subunit alpha
MPRLMFQRPRRIEWEELGPRYGRMAAEPFEKGYALTVGNSLRRVLLSVIPGAAITSVKMPGVGASATGIPGVEEGVPELLLNLKKVVVRLADDRPVTARIDVAGPRSVTAADIHGAGVEVLNPEVALATVGANGKLALELEIRPGRGYVSAERHGEPPPSGAVSLDAAFSPVQRVNYTVEMSRLGKITDYEKLVVEVWTDGSIAPEQALLRASKLLRDHFDLFTPAGAEEDDEEVPPEPVAPTEGMTSS